VGHGGADPGAEARRPEGLAGGHRAELHVAALREAQEPVARQGRRRAPDGHRPRRGAGGAIERVELPVAGHDEPVAAEDDAGEVDPLDLGAPALRVAQAAHRGDVWLGVGRGGRGDGAVAGGVVVDAGLGALDAAEPAAQPAGLGAEGAEAEVAREAPVAAGEGGAEREGALERGRHEGARVDRGHGDRPLGGALEGEGEAAVGAEAERDRAVAELRAEVERAARRPGLEQGAAELDEAFEVEEDEAGREVDAAAAEFEARAAAGEEGVEVGAGALGAGRVGRRGDAHLEAGPEGGVGARPERRARPAAPADHLDLAARRGHQRAPARGEALDERAEVRGEVVVDRAEAVEHHAGLGDELGEGHRVVEHAHVG
jgi:hypothetical protein